MIHFHSFCTCKKKNYQPDSIFFVVVKNHTKLSQLDPTGLFAAKTHAKANSPRRGCVILNFVKKKKTFLFSLQWLCVILTELGRHLAMSRWRQVKKKKLAIRIPPKKNWEKPSTPPGKKKKVGFATDYNLASGKFQWWLRGRTDCSTRAGSTPTWRRRRGEWSGAPINKVGRVQTASSGFFFAMFFFGYIFFMGIYRLVKKIFRRSNLRTLTTSCLPFFSFATWHTWGRSRERERKKKR